MTNTQNQPNMISVEQAKAILQFLQRTQMQGAEMPVYVDIFNCLSAIISEEAPKSAAVANDDVKSLAQ